MHWPILPYSECGVAIICSKRRWGCLTLGRTMPPNMDHWLRFCSLPRWLRRFCEVDCGYLLYGGAIQDIWVEYACRSRFSNVVAYHELYALRRRRHQYRFGCARNRWIAPSTYLVPFGATEKLGSASRNAHRVCEWMRKVLTDRRRKAVPKYLGVRVWRAYHLRTIEKQRPSALSPVGKSSPSQFRRRRRDSVPQRSWVCVMWKFFQIQFFFGNR